MHEKWQTFPFWDINENLKLWKANAVTPIYKFIKRLCFMEIFFFMTFSIKKKEIKTGFEICYSESEICHF